MFFSRDTPASGDAGPPLLDPKAAVRVATTANLVSRAGLLTIDDVTLVDGDRVLDKDASTGALRGIYVAHVGAWTRALDAIDGVLAPGAYVFVTEGTVNAGRGYVLRGPGPIIVGTTSQNWTRIGGAEYVGSTYIDITGTTVSAKIGLVGDLQAVGAAAVGASGRLADAAHVHPTTGIVLTNGANVWTGNQDTGGVRITNLGTPIAPGDASTKGYGDSTYDKLDGSNAWTGDHNAGGHKLGNLADPTNPADATTKSWVETKITTTIQGLDPKQSVDIATTAALPSFTHAVPGTLQGSANGAFPTTDGVAPTVGMSILVKDETAGNAPYNGIYTVVSLGSVGTKYVLTRRTDADTSAKLTSGAYVYVSQGTANAGTGWVLTGTDPVLETDPITFAKFTSITDSQYVTRDGLRQMTGDWNVGNHTFSNLAGLGVGTASLGASAAVQVDSTTRGLLGPRWTTVQRDAIGSPAEGLEGYDTTVHLKTVYNGSGWGYLAPLTSSAATTVTTANAAGTATSAAHADHAHDHGAQSTGTHHAAATPSLAGFVSTTSQTLGGRKALVDGLNIYADTYPPTTGVFGVKSDGSDPRSVLSYSVYGGSNQYRSLSIGGDVAGKTLDTAGLYATGFDTGNYAGITIEGDAKRVAHSFATPTEALTGEWTVYIEYDRLLFRNHMDTLAGVDVQIHGYDAGDTAVDKVGGAVSFHAGHSKGAAAGSVLAFYPSLTGAVSGMADNGEVLAFTIAEAAVTSLVPFTVTSSHLASLLGGARIDVGSDATGDLLYRDATPKLAPLGIGSPGQFLWVAGGLPAWHTLAVGDVSGAVAATRLINTTSPLAGGGDLSADRTLTLNIGAGLTTSGSNLVPDFGTGAGKVVQGNDAALTNDRTASGIRTATTVVSVSAATAPSANQVLKASSSTLASWVTLTTSDVSGAVSTSRAINTTAPLAGGGDFSADRTLTIADAAFNTTGVVNTSTQTLGAGAKTVRVADTNTNTSVTGFTVTHSISSGTPANSIGVKQLFQLPNASGTLIDAFTVNVVLEDAGAGTEKASIDFRPYYGGVGSYSNLKLGADGTITTGAGNPVLFGGLVRIPNNQAYYSETTGGGGYIPLAQLTNGGLNILGNASFNTKLSAGTTLTLEAGATTAMTATSTLVSAAVALQAGARWGTARTVPGAYPYTSLGSDSYIAVTSTASARTINLIAAATFGAGNILEIADESGGAGTNNITIDANSTETIDGALTKVINSNYGSVRLRCTGTGWQTIGSAAAVTGYIKADGTVPLTADWPVGAFGLKFTERSTPSTPSANDVILYARDNGSGKTQVCVMTSDGVVGVLWTQA